MSVREMGQTSWLQRAAPVALAFTIAIAWINFLTTTQWASVPGSLHGWREPYYALALFVVTALTVWSWRRIGSPAAVGRAMTTGVLVAGLALCAGSLVARLPPSTWTDIPFEDDWTELFQQASNGVALLRRGVVVGWNWWMLGGHPTSADLGQNFGVVAFLPMTILGDRVGYHVLHVVLFLFVPALVWLDLRHEDQRLRALATGLAAIFAAGYSGPLGLSGDTNSLVGVSCAGLAMLGSHFARRGAAWGGPALLAGLTLALYTHASFFAYAIAYLLLEALYFRDSKSLWRLAAAAAVAGLASLPIHWESIRYGQYLILNNMAYTAGEQTWGSALRAIYYNAEMLAMPHRWFNHYPSLPGVWLPVLVVTALLPGRSRAGFYAWATLMTVVLLRLKTSETGAGFDRMQHMIPLVMAPAIALFILRAAGSRALALSICVVLLLYVQVLFTPIRHVPGLRAFNPALADRIAAADGMVLVETSPHRDVDSDPGRRSPTTPFGVHFEALLPSLAGQRFYSQMIDGWHWSIFRNQVVAAGTFAGRRVDDTPPDAFVAEMAKWGVRHLFVWTDTTRDYLRGAGAFIELWREDRWSHFERRDADVRTVVTEAGTGELKDLDFLGADVVLDNVRRGDLVVVRANYYPAWRARDGSSEVPLFARERQLAFNAPRDGSYVVRLDYPRYRWMNLASAMVFVAGIVLFWRSSRAI